jgi:hypothetical protein
VAAGNESLDLALELSRSTVVAVPPSEVLTSVHDRLLPGMAGSGRCLASPEGGRTVTLGFSMELAEQRAGPPVQQERLALGEQWRRSAQRTPERRVTINDRARAVLVSSADRPFKGDEETFDPARPDAALDFDGGDRFELPALSCMFVEHLLELVAGHLAADHALAELDHRVLVAVRHATTIVAASA